jgi:hypothetical protein
MKRTILMLYLSALISSCTSTGISIIERSDSLSVAPEWASMNRSSYKKDGRLYFVGFISADGNSSPSAALNASDEKALSSPMQSLVNQFMDQNQVGEDLQNSTGQRIISSLRSERIPMPSLQITNRYWERVRVPAGEHVSRTELRVFSLAEVTETDFERAREIAFKKIQGKSEIRNLLDEVGKKQRESISPQ